MEWNEMKWSEGNEIEWNVLSKEKEWNGVKLSNID